MKDERSDTSDAFWDSPIGRREMLRRSLIGGAGLAGAAFGVYPLLRALAGASTSQPATGPAATQPADSSRKGGLDVTFLVASDLHFGCKASMATSQGESLRAVPVEQIHPILVEQMNQIEGKAYPAEIGGKVGKPLGLVAPGDLTDNGAADQWANFVKFYGLTGKDGLLKMPVYETIGNHDTYSLLPIVKEAVRKRHGADCYGLDWGDLHIACVGEPDDGCFDWLAKDLAAVGKDRPILCTFHYPPVGPYSDKWWFGQDDHRNKFAAVLKGYNVIGLIHGHFHGTGCYVWKGYDTYDIGSPKNAWKDFLVVHVTDKQLTVCAWNYERTPGWWWCHAKPINGAPDTPDKRIVKIYDRPGLLVKPVIPYPLFDPTVT